MNKIFHAIIVAAGSGTRSGKEMPKQYCEIAGKPLINYSIEKFLKHGSCESLTIVIDPAHEKYLKNTAGQYLGDINIVYGGKERYQSTYNALINLDHLDDTSAVLIHDAARPFLTCKNIDQLLEALNSYDAATLATPAVDTFRYSKESAPIVTNKSYNNSPERSNLWAIQTPQAFKYGAIKQAHEHVRQDLLGYAGVSDDTSLLSKLNLDVKIIAASSMNFKITQAEDFIMAEQLLSRPRISKTATGYDVHAFEEYEVVGNQIKLGGIHIPHSYELKGHSDADVALHALTDALYGLIADGDIGMHFPPSKSEHKDQDSAVFLDAATKSVKQKGGIIRHVDLTIICEKPAIGPYRDDIRARIAEIMKIDISDVSVKATTTEGLGFTGRREGIATQANVSADFEAPEV